MLEHSASAGSALPLATAPPGGSRRCRLANAVAFLGRPVTPRSWNALLYCCGGAAGASLLAYVLFPTTGEFVVFTSLMFFTSGPFSTFLPSASEPILLAFGKLQPPLLLACLGVGGIALAEWINYRVFGAVLHAPRLKTVREARLMQQATAWFYVQPFWTVVVCAFTPIPFWMVRTCAVVARYPLGRFVVATVLGRFPRIWLIALLGSALPFTSLQIGFGGAVVVVLLALVATHRARRTRDQRGLR